MTLLPAFPAHLRLWAVRAVVAFLAAVEALAGLVISSTIAGGRAVPCKVTILSTLAAP